MKDGVSMPSNDKTTAIALDCMGGDNAPAAQVEGAVRAIHEADLNMILVGDEAKIKNELRKHNASNLPLQIRHTTEIVTNEDQPTSVVRRKKDSSLVVACRLVSEGEAGAVLSCGNTGALLAAGLFVIGRMRGVERPALAPILPTKDGNGFLLLDAGANAEGKPEYLLQYAIMGSLYQHLVCGIKEPRVGLLNVGTEEGKGNELYKATYNLLKDAPVHFVGNVEARELTDGVADVVVCDGFTGNILLKCTEGMGSLIADMIQEELKRDVISKVGAAIALPAIKRLKKRLDYAEYGGSPFLGLNGLAVKAHGSSNALAVFGALMTVQGFIQSDMNRLLKQTLDTMQA